jgi:hypothetical protein
VIHDLRRSVEQFSLEIRKGIRELRSAEQLQLAAGAMPSPLMEQQEAELRERIRQPGVTPVQQGAAPATE